MVVLVVFLVYFFNYESTVHIGGFDFGFVCYQIWIRMHMYVILKYNVCDQEIKIRKMVVSGLFCFLY